MFIVFKLHVVLLGYPGQEAGHLGVGCGCVRVLLNTILSHSEYVTDLRKTEDPLYIKPALISDHQRRSWGSSWEARVKGKILCTNYSRRVGCVGWKLESVRIRICTLLHYFHVIVPLLGEEVPVKVKNFRGVTFYHMRRWRIWPANVDSCRWVSLL